MSLQSLAAKEVLSNIPINAETQDELDKFCLEYISGRPTIKDALLRDLWYVCWRTRDAATIKAHKDKYSISFIVKSFFSEKSAKEWILKNGRDYVLDVADYYDYDRGIILYIVESKNDGVYDPDTGGMEMISGRLYDTYVFDEISYKIALKEHSYMYWNDWIGCSWFIPFWIHYVREDDLIAQPCEGKRPQEVERGGNLEYHLKFMSKREYVEKDRKEKNRIEFDEYVRDPDAWVARIMNK
jgi:hypothetical protein